MHLNYTTNRPDEKQLLGRHVEAGLSDAAGQTMQILDNTKWINK